MTPDFIGALLIGLLGSGHCIGMCGGIASLLSLNQKPIDLNHPPSQYRQLLSVLAYNLGRISSYMLFGAMVGGITASLSQLTQLNHILILLRLVAALLMVALGLYIGRWWFGILKLEHIGKHLWRWISPAGRSLLPLKKTWHALPFGFIWGWLPCGLVYSMLTWSAVAGNAFSGALIMGAFGVGTLPAMLFIGLGAQYLTRLQASTLFRKSAAISIILYGIYTGYDATKMLLILYN